MPYANYVRSTGTYGINSYDRPEGDQMVRTYPGMVLPADHWAVRQASGYMFEPISDEEAAAAMSDSGAELARMADRFGPDRSTWPAGQRQRAENLERSIARQAEERAEHADRERRRGMVAQFAARGASEPGDGNVDVRGPRSPEFMQRVDPWDVDPRGLTRAQARDRGLKVLDSREHTRHLKPDQLNKLDKLMRAQNQSQDGGWLAKYTLLTESSAYRSAFQQLLTRATPAFSPEEAQAIQEVTTFRAMSIGTDSAGGFGVPVLIDPTIILTAQGSLNPFRRISRQVTITTDEWKGVSSAGVTWSYDAEASTVSDDSPALAQPTVPMSTARGFIPYSIEVGMDYPSFAEEMGRLLMEGYDELQAQAYATGSGSGQPRGIITALDANTNVEVAVTTDGAFGGVDINKVWGALPDRFKANATWVMSHDVGNEIATFGNGNNLGFATVDLTGMVQTIRMRPVEFSSYMPDFTGTTGASNILVVGDFRNYLIADRAGMSVELIPHLFDPTTNRPTGQRGLYAWARHGANSVADNAFRLLQNT